MTVETTRPLRVDFVAPPFAGHLFPQLDLIRGYSADTPIDRQGDARLFTPRILSTVDAESAVSRAELPLHVLLRGREKQVAAISDKQYQVSRNPLLMYRQFRENLALMPLLQNELTKLWETDRPDIAVVDFCIPIAGHVARRLGIKWWTSMPTPCAMETRSGVPSYLGGMRPDDSLKGRLRHWYGRQMVRAFKRGVFLACRRHLVSIGFTRLYRPDGSEMTYSDECVLASGAREFEFNADWPASVRFIGPLPGGPPVDYAKPQFDASRKKVLVSLGTHIQWAKDYVQPLIAGVAEKMPAIDFHFTLGKADRNANGAPATKSSNLFIHKYLPYTELADQFDAALVHGGTGIVYSCLQAAVPMLVWPQDFDQFDHAARVEHHGLGLRCRETVDSIVEDLERLLHNTAIRSRCAEFQSTLSEYSPHQSFRDELIKAKTSHCQDASI